MQRSAPVPVGVSARHVHLSAEHLTILFGPRHELTPRNPLSQPGQFAAEEVVVVAGPSGALERVRVLGPVRSVSQVELATTDCLAIGIVAAVRDSGDVLGSPGVVMVGPKGSVALTEGAIVAARHLHLAPLDAKLLGVSNGDFLTVAAGSGRRTTVFDSVVCRVGESCRMELHLDTDEANAAGCRSGDMAWIMDTGATAVAATAVAAAGAAAVGAAAAGAAPATSAAATFAATPVVPSSVPRLEGERGLVDMTRQVVITEDNVIAVARLHPQAAIVASVGAILTPLARDAVARFGVELIRR